MFKQHGAKIALVQVILSMAMAGLLLFLFFDFVKLFAEDILTKPEMMLEEVGSTMGNFIFGTMMISALSMAGYFIGWRIALVRERESFISSFLYGIIAAFPSIFSLIILAVAFAVLLVLIGLVLGAIAGYTLTIETATTAPGVAVFIFYAIYVIMFLFLCARLIVTGPVMAAERGFNPFSALATSWKLTKNNSMIIMLYLFLVSVAFTLLFGVVGYLTSLAAMASITLAMIVGGSLFMALATLYLLFPAGIYIALTNPVQEVEQVFS
ncbi:glycerophosphoryl diester phosphodiesterase membrane domain-containing protein [Parasphingorhabdus cellanae]|uniref:Glycerophosphoryl diester phosphodiesterase membrane domain-containing protein n=1 Tax=Parasphingorhabdus cellanae TaxID=2806553 RepID=A0ABX7T916_9SPHN|nr:glycerophosphoryl diester phosphodiesterase membrane domain-containing protein [Parasphingorhabdus cellanae]QTD56712.1 glycerophosphoryl diester phosphodiesterase membrane domain-containing protein [Parasphingorhabdus cellanae]